MKLTQAGKMAFSAVLSNKLRLFLTMLGIIIGVMAVTLLISLVQGATNTVTSQLDELGGNQLIVSISNRQKRLTLREVQALEEEAEVEAVSPTLTQNGSATGGGNQTDVSITGVTAAYPQVQGMELAAGRTISALDNEYRLSVCVIGQTVLEDLFGGGAQEALGKTIRLSGRDYRIVGVLTEQMQTMMADPNAAVYIPLTNAQRLLSNVSIQTFYVTAAEDSSVEALRETLRTRLREKYGNDDDFTIVNMADVLDIIDNVMGTLSLLLGAIAGISLVVGGIGIMNIMLVSVTERTREIGIRKAIGAQHADIVVQFMIESVVISVVGGLIGMAASWGILTAINTAFPDYHFAISANVAAIALGFSVLVGLIFGIYPANKAAGLKPINALRYE